MENDGHTTSKEETPHHKFLEWLHRNMLSGYQQSLEDQGFEELESLTLLTDEEINELSTAISMKLGHKKKFPVAIQQAREELQEARDDITREKRYVKEEQEEQRERDREEQKEQRRMEKELTTIEREQKLRKAKAQVDAEEPSKVGTNTTLMEVSKGKNESKIMALPATKSYAAFISHKKTHSKHLDSSSTLSRSLKVTHCEVCAWLSICTHIHWLYLNMVIICFRIC
jgi:hypothetical protein